MGKLTSNAARVAILIARATDPSHPVAGIWRAGLRSPAAGHGSFNATAFFMLQPDDPSAAACRQELSPKKQLNAHDLGKFEKIDSPECLVLSLYCTYAELDSRRAAAP
jgi:hypothetical protein